MRISLVSMKFNMDFRKRDRMSPSQRRWQKWKHKQNKKKAQREQSSWWCTLSHSFELRSIVFMTTLSQPKTSTFAKVLPVPHPPCQSSSDNTSFRPPNRMYVHIDECCCCRSLCCFAFFFVHCSVFVFVFGFGCLFVYLFIFIWSSFYSQQQRIVEVCLCFYPLRN